MSRPDLQVVDVRTQVFVENLLKRSVRLDVLATDSTGRKFNIEIQREDRGAGRRRARYNSSMMDANLLRKGERYDDLTDTFVIFITEKDVLGKGLPVYQIERCILDTGERFDDGSHILYVNGAYRGDSPVGKLMHDFSCTDPEDMHYSILADRVRFFKERKEGIAVMCKVMEEMRNQAMEEGKREGKEEGIRENMREIALRMLAVEKYDMEEIAAVSGLPLEEVEQLKTNRNA